MTQPSPAAGPEEAARATDAAAPRQPTRGNLLRIQGRFVQLPADAYVQREITETTCTGSEQCAQIPIYEIVRGNSTVAVSGRSGAILSEEVAPGEEGAFDFLRSAR